MNLVHCNPQHKLSRRNLDRGNIFDDLLAPFFVQGEVPSTQKSGNMKVDIFEKDNAIFLEAEMPGVEKEDITVDVKGKQITLGGERKSKTETKENNCYRRERVYGKFERTFNLPFDIKSSDVKASFKNGILELEIPKPEEQVVQKIAIN